MPIICRMLEVPPDNAAELSADRGNVEGAVKSAKIYSDVYRYWHAIDYLLAQHRPGSLAAKWLQLGKAVSKPTAEIPAARIIFPQEVAELHAALRDIEPDALGPHYDAEALDEAGIYPRTWREWEETFDPLGQVLEHYSFLQYSIKNCTSSGNALLLYFVDDGED